MAIIYCDEEKDIPKVSLSSIKFLTKQLGDFIDIYGRKVRITDEEALRKFEKLSMISVLLERGMYDRLITNPNAVIDFKDDNEDYLPEYFPL